MKKPFTQIQKQFYRQLLHATNVFFEKKSLLRTLSSTLSQYIIFTVICDRWCHFINDCTVIIVVI